VEGIRNAWVGGSIPLSGTNFGRREYADRGVENPGETLAYVVYCSRHRQDFRLALDALTAPKIF